MSTRKQPNTLTLVYDDQCVLCRRSVDWLGHRRTHIDLEFLAASSPQAIAEFGHTPEYGDHMIAAADDGRAWIGPPDAYLATMWAVRGLRWLSYVLAWRPLRPIARRGFMLVTANRHMLGNLVDDCPRCAAAPRASA